jgi:hypothetical protein
MVPRGESAKAEEAKTNTIATIAAAIARTSLVRLIEQNLLLLALCL